MRIHRHGGDESPFVVMLQAQMSNVFKTDFRPMRYDELVEMGMTVGELGDKIITYRCQAAGEADRQLLAEGYLAILICIKEA